MYAPPLILTPTLLRALRIADKAAASATQPSSNVASYAGLPDELVASYVGLPDELVVRIGSFAVSRHPHPAPRYAGDGVYYFQPTWQPLRLVDRRSARVLPAPASSTFTLPQGLCTIT